MFVLNFHYWTNFGSLSRFPPEVALSPFPFILSIRIGQSLLGGAHILMSSPLFINTKFCVEHGVRILWCVRILWSARIVYKWGPKTIKGYRQLEYSFPIWIWWQQPNIQNEKLKNFQVNFSPVQRGKYTSYIAPSNRMEIITFQGTGTTKCC